MGPKGGGVARKQPTELKTADVMERLRSRHAAPAWAFLESVRNGTGYSRSPRTADALAMSLYPSRGLHLHGFEVKVSRGDWLREVRDPEKAEAIARHCHYWWVVATEGVVDDDLLGPEIPTTWGYMLADKDGIKVVKQATLMEAKPPDHLLLAAILRVTAAHATDAAKLEAARKAGHAEGFATGKGSAEDTIRFERESHARLQKSVDEFEAASGVRISQWDGKQIGEAVRLVRQGDFARQLKALQQAAERISRDAAKAMAEVGVTSGGAE